MTKKKKTGFVGITATGLPETPVQAVQNYSYPTSQPSPYQRDIGLYSNAETEVSWGGANRTITIGTLTSTGIMIGFSLSAYMTNVGVSTNYLQVRLDILRGGGNNYYTRNIFLKPSATTSTSLSSQSWWNLTGECNLPVRPSDVIQIRIVSNAVAANFIYGYFVGVSVQNTN